MTRSGRPLQLVGFACLAGLLLGAPTPAANGAGATSGRLEIPAEVRAVRDTRVPAEVAGRVARRPEDETAPVRAGEVVVTLDDALLSPAARSADAAAVRAAARKDWAGLEFKRVQALFEKGTTDQSELDRSRLALREAVAAAEAAAADAELARARLARTRIRAPFDGRLVAVAPQLGEFLRVGQTAFRIVDLTSLRLLAYLTAEQLEGSKLRHGTAVEVEAEHEARGAKPIRASVYAIASAAEGPARTFRIEVRVAGPDGERGKGTWLRPGMRVRLRLQGAVGR